MLPLALALAAKYAPDLIRLMTNSDTAGAVADKVIGIAQDVTGTTDPEAAAFALDKEPALSEAFRQAVMANSTELERLYLADVANARDRDVKLAEATGRHNWRATFMLVATYIGMIACVILMLFRDIDANTAIGGAIIFLLGKFSGNWEAAFNFEFGTSQSSKDKDTTIARLTKK